MPFDVVFLAHEKYTSLHTPLSECEEDVECCHVLFRCYHHHYTKRVRERKQVSKCRTKREKNTKKKKQGLKGESTFVMGSRCETLSNACNCCRFSCSWRSVNHYKRSKYTMKQKEGEENKGRERKRIKSEWRGTNL